MISYECSQFNTFNAKERYPMPNTEKEKQLAAEASVKFVKDGMVVGLGTGSTAEFMIRQLGEKVANGLSMTGVPSSERTANLAQELGIPLTPLDKVDKLDLYIDGADEIDAQFNMIKGGGGALLREKILAYNSKFNVIIVDSSKKVESLGKFRLPLEVIPLAHKKVVDQLIQLGLNPILRKLDNSEYRTDENNFILDINISGQKNLKDLNTRLLEIPGVVETGLFLDYVNVLILGRAGDVEVTHVNRN
ncbi:ribose-5-phosphate isomerase RpiA [Flagellimonas meridianipacifica]|uniref:Ribose-5-phosphate isomerase A n=1 Tax=Flagellimonas meridianipacifica TaxID=1080225 RepID=A0A2T0MIR8_9FLAO|nr:ribose-5-phosphate isomerase RpiA [Allomuricauda pacifica]PRX57453.1 ribose 5-phosphate isomerase A [Allomuricauda pacifica]